MASSCGPARPGQARLRRAGVATAMALALAGSAAGCVNMPDSGPVGTISATPQSTAGGGDIIEPFPSGPTRGESPGDIVNGFLAASASYPANAAIAREYLLGSASKAWSPTWSVTVFNTLTVSDPVPVAAAHHGARQVEVDASGDAQSAFNGSGQFVSAQNKADINQSWPFKLTQVGGQWRISNPPQFRLLNASQFTEFYKAQDLYFVNPTNIPASMNQALVPDSVFVPVGTLANDLVTKLVTALLPDAGGQPQSRWLRGAAVTFPAGTKLISVALAGTTAVVNLGGLTGASNTALEQVSAQLTWTLASPRAGPPPAIQSVELELNGKAWTPPGIICGSSQSRSPVQNQASYPCYNPYPSQPAGFSFIDHGQIWSRCGSEAIAQQGRVGEVVSVFHAASSQVCGDYVPTDSGATPPPVSLPARYGTPAMAALSPDGDYVAYYSPDKKAVLAGPSTAAGSLRQVAGAVGSGVSSLSWDRNDDLWIAQNGNVFMVPVSGKATLVTMPPENVTALSVAPDGVRIALVVQTGSGREVQLAAIIHNIQSSQGHLGLPSDSIAGVVQIGPDLVEPDALTWYDADDLIVLAGTSDRTLAEVPVDGQDSSGLQSTPDGAVSITADGAQNALVAGLAGNHLAVSTGLEGPWQSLGVLGQNPAYPG